MRAVKSQGSHMGTGIADKGTDNTTLGTGIADKGTDNTTMGTGIADKGTDNTTMGTGIAVNRQVGQPCIGALLRVYIVRTVTRHVGTHSASLSPFNFPLAMAGAGAASAAIDHHCASSYCCSLCALWAIIANYSTFAHHSRWSTAAVILRLPIRCWHLHSYLLGTTCRRRTSSKRSCARTRTPPNTRRTQANAPHAHALTPTQVHPAHRRRGGQRRRVGHRQDRSEPPAPGAARARGHPILPAQHVRYRRLPRCAAERAA